MLTQEFGIDIVGEDNKMIIHHSRRSTSANSSNNNISTNSINKSTSTIHPAHAGQGQST